MKSLLMACLALLLLTGGARAQCNKEITKPQKPRKVARQDWTAAGRVWQVVLSWRTKSVSDNGEEEAAVVLGVRDNIEHPKIGDFRVYDLTPDRCNLQVDPMLSTVKLMSRDFLLVTLPDSGGSGSVVMAYLYSIDEKGHLTQVFHSVYRGHFLRSLECRYLWKSYIRSESADGSRFTWVYEYPLLEWVHKKSECAKAKIDRIEFTYTWKNGCFPVEEPAKQRWVRLTTDWDADECVPGVGRVSKNSTPDGGAGK